MASPILIFLFIWLFSLYLLFFYKPIYIPAEYWIEDVLTLKKHLLENRDENKNTIFFAGGSSNLFGISTKILEEKLDYNIANITIHASVPISFYLNFIKKYAKRGDIIIVPTEYINISRSYLNNWTYTQFTTWGMKYQSLLHFKIQKWIFWKNLTSYWKRIPNLFKPLPIASKEEIIKNSKDKLFSKSAYSFLGLNKYAEFFLDTSPIVSIDAIDYSPPEKAIQFFIEEISQLNSYAKENGIQFYMTYPITIKSDKFNTDTENIKEQLQKYEDVFKNMRVNFFGTSSFYNIDINYFYDGPYHLNATGATLRSLLLAEDIKTCVLGKEASYKQGKEKEFFKQKEKETIEYIEELRKIEIQKRLRLYNYGQYSLY